MNISAIKKILLGGFLTLVFGCVGNVAYADTCTSQGTGDWETAGTWTACSETVPQFGDDVVIANTHTVTITGTMNAVTNITIQSGGILTQGNTNTQTIAGTLLIQSGGVLTHGDNTTTQANEVDFSATDIIIDTGGAVDVADKGYDGGYGDDDDGDGSSGGAHGVYAQGGAGGGGHFGDGGDGSSGWLGGEADGDISDPATIGSGGGGDHLWETGGAGGGLIIINASGTITVNGIIAADGANTPGNAGGGAGGAVKLVADTIDGTPDAFTVTGGDASVGGNDGGGGGGGVYIEYTTASSISGADITMNGGDAGASGENGGAGLVYIKDTDGDDSLYTDNNGIVGVETNFGVASLTVDYLTVTDYAILTIDTGEELILSNANSITGGDNNGTLKISNGTFETQTSFTLAGTILDFWSTATWTSSDSVNMTVASGGTFTQSYYTAGGDALPLSAITVNSGGTITHSDNSTAQTHVVKLAAGSMDLQTGGSIDVAGKGYDGGYGDDDDGEGSAAGTHGTYGLGTSGAGGGGHFGDGGDGAGTGVGGEADGDISDPATIGSGGGGDHLWETGGAGGGLIIINASGTITVNGTIAADGANTPGNAGGGAGGAVKLVADTIAGDPDAFSITGGDAAVGGNDGGGGGGGLYIEYTTASSISGADITMNGGDAGASGENGGAGLVYIKDTDGDESLYSDNNGIVGVETNFGVASLTVDYLTVTDYAILTIDTGEELILSNANSITGGDNNGTLKISNGTFETQTNFTLAGTILDFWSTAIWTSSSSVNMTVASGGTFVQSYFTAEGDALPLSAITVNSGGTITHSDNSTAQTHIIKLAAGSMDLQTGGFIDVAGKGYDGGYDDDDGEGSAAGAHGISGWGGGGAGGGGHFGDGGDGSSGLLGGEADGDISDPATIGSGGGGHPYIYTGGGGGGLVIINVSGTITVNGTIAADGADTSSYGGGGGGGAVKLVADTINGTPDAFTVTGGDTADATNGGGGGGGGVYVRYVVSSSFDSGDVSVAGGSKGSTGENGYDGEISFGQLNIAPTVAITPAFLSQATDASGYVTFTVGVNDPDADNLEVKVDYTTDAGVSWYRAYLDSATPSYGATPSVSNGTYDSADGQFDTVDTSSGENTLTMVWDSQYADASYTPITTEPGTVQIRVTVDDGSVTANDTSLEFTVDNQAPSTGTITIESTTDPDGDDAYTSSATENITVSSVTGAAEMKFSNDDATYSVYEPYGESKAAWDLTDALYGGDSSEEAKTVYAIFKDSSGNESTAITDNIVFDTTSPTNPTAAVDDQGAVNDTWSNSTDDPNFTSFTGEFDTNGVYQYYYYFDTSSTGTTIDSTLTDDHDPASLATSDTRYLRVIAQDNAGNWADPDGGSSSCTNTNADRPTDADCWTTIFTHKFDEDAPNTPAPVSSPTSWTYSNSFNFSWVDPGDAVSGIANYTYETNAGTLSTTTADETTLDVTLSSDADGTKLFEVFATDNANNDSATGSVNFYYDSVNPTNAGTVTDSNGSLDDTWATISDPDFVWTVGTDATSGVDEYDVYWGTDAASVTPTATVSSNAYDAAAAITANTSYYLRINTRDTAGNTSGWETKYTFKYSQQPGNSSSLSQTTTQEDLSEAALTMGEWTSDSRPTLQFILTDPDTDSLGYIIYIDDDSDFSSPAVHYTYGANDIPSGTTQGFTVGQAVDTGGSYTVGAESQALTAGNYYWKVQAVESHGLTSSEVIANTGSVAFQLELTPPDISGVTMSAPVTTTRGVELALTGTPTDADSGLHATPYKFYNLTEGTDSGWQTGTTWSDNTLDASNIYVFKVEVRDAVENSVDSSTLGVTTEDAPASIISSGSSGGSGGSSNNDDDTNDDTDDNDDYTNDDDTTPDDEILDDTGDDDTTPDDEIAYTYDNYIPNDTTVEDSIPYSNSVEDTPETEVVDDESLLKEATKPVLIVIEDEILVAMVIEIENIENVIKKIDLLELQELEGTPLPKIEKSEEEKLVDTLLDLDLEDATKKEKKTIENSVNKFFKEALADSGIIDKSEKIEFYPSYKEAEKAREKNPNINVYDPSTDKNKDSVSDIFQAKKGYNLKYTDAAGRKYTLADKIIFGGDPEISSETLITEIPRITNFGKGQKVEGGKDRKGGRVSLIVGADKEQNLSVYIFNDNKEIVTTINSSIDEGNKEVFVTTLPEGKYYAVPVGDEGTGDPVKIVVEEAAEKSSFDGEAPSEENLVLIESGYFLQMIFKMMLDYGLIDEEIIPKKTYIEGYAKPGSTIIASWKSIVFNSVVIADASQGYFKIEVPGELKVGNHETLVYSYDEASLTYSPTQELSFEK